LVGKGDYVSVYIGDRELIATVKRFCRENGISLSELVREFFRSIASGLKPEGNVARDNKVVFDRPVFIINIQKNLQLQKMEGGSTIPRRDREHLAKMIHRYISQYPHSTAVPILRYILKYILGEEPEEYTLFYPP